MALLEWLFFSLFSVYIFFRPLCGALEVSYYAWAVWVLSHLVNECYQVRQNYVMWASNWYNYVDVFMIVLLIAACFLRWIISTHGDTYQGISGVSASSFLDWFNIVVYDGELRPSWWTTDLPPYAAGVRGQVGVDASGTCAWTIELELLRWLLGVSIVAMFSRFLEFFAFQKEIGVLMVCTSRMMIDLLNWLPLMLVITFGFAFGFNILAPNYQLEDATGPLFVLPFLTLDLSTGGPFMAPLWALFGFYEPGLLAASTGSALISPFFLWCPQAAMRTRGLAANLDARRSLTAPLARSLGPDAQGVESRALEP